MKNVDPVTSQRSVALWRGSPLPTPSRKAAVQQGAAQRRFGCGSSTLLSVGLTRAAGAKRAATHSLHRCVVIATPIGSFGVRCTPCRISRRTWSRSLASMMPRGNSSPSHDRSGYRSEKSRSPRMEGSTWTPSLAELRPQPSGSTAWWLCPMKWSARFVTWVSNPALMWPPGYEFGGPRLK